MSNYWMRWPAKGRAVGLCRGVLRQDWRPVNASLGGLLPVGQPADYGRPMAETILNARGTRQRAAEVQRGTARAAVLGVSDGLVTNVSLILGVAAAELSPAVVRL